MSAQKIGYLAYVCHLNVLPPEDQTPVACKSGYPHHDPGNNNAIKPENRVVMQLGKRFGKEASGV